MAITTLANVKEYLAIPSGTTTEDDLITDLMNASITFIQSETDQYFEPVAETRYYGIKNCEYRKLFLDEYLQTITTLTNGDSDATEISSSNYILMPKNRNAYKEIWLKSSSIYSWESDIDDGEFIVVEGTWGLFSSVPDDIRRIADRLTAYFYRQKDNHQDFDRTVIASSGVILPANVPSDIMRTIYHYRKIL